MRMRPTGGAQRASAAPKAPSRRDEAPGGATHDDRRSPDAVGVDRRDLMARFGAGPLSVDGQGEAQA